MTYVEVVFVIVDGFLMNVEVAMGGQVVAYKGVT